MTAQEDRVVLNPPAKLNGREAEPLKTLLTEKRGRPVTLEFAQVTQLGTQSMQVLMAAKTAWEADALPFEITNMSTEIRETLQICGLSPARVGAKEVHDDA